MRWKVYSCGHGFKILCAEFLDEADMAIFCIAFQTRYPGLRCVIEEIQ